MIYKVLNQNYLLQPYLTKKLSVGIIAICILHFLANAQANCASPNIINGSTPDDVLENTCSEQELLDYVEKAKKIIGSKWQPIKGFEDRNVVIMFTVKQNGEIEGEQILEESGSQAVDKSALAALKSASPLPPLPKGAPDSIQIRYVFSWHVTR